MTDTKKKVGLAVIGTGHWGPNLVRNFYDDPRVELKYICDIDRLRAHNIASRYRDMRITSDYLEVLTDPTVDAVVICTPTDTHFKLARMAIQHGKDLFIEKPMATSSLECEILNDLAKEKGVKLMVGHVFLFNPAVLYVKGLIDRAELGDITYIYGQRLNLGPIRKDVNALWDLAPHDIAIFNYWLGTSPVFANANGIEYVNPPIHDVVFMNLRYPNNVMASLQVSWLDPRKIRQMVVVGTKRMAIFDDLDPVGPVHIYDKTVKKQYDVNQAPDTIQAFKAVVQEGDLIIPKIPAGEPLKNECRGFIDWVVDGKEPISNGKNGLEVVRVLEAATRSLNLRGAEVAVNGPRAHQESSAKPLEAAA